MYQPVAGDLRFVVSTLKINHDLERIGDLAVNIARKVRGLVLDPPPELSCDLGLMCEKTQFLLRDSIDSLVSLNASDAATICTRDDEIDQMKATVRKEIETAIRQRPEKVRGLVLLCGSFGNVTSTFQGTPLLELVLPKLVELADKAPEVVRAVWSRLPAQLSLKLALKAGEIDPARIHPEDILPYLSHMTHVDFPLFLRMLRAAGEHTAGDILPHIDVPVLVVAGERDSFTPSFLATAMAETLPKGELLIVPGGTHVAPLEQPELVDARITTFLRDRVL